MVMEDGEVMLVECRAAGEEMEGSTAAKGSLVRR